MTTALDHGRFDAERWLSACLAAADGRVEASPEIAQAAAEQAFGRRFTIHPFRPEDHFAAVLVAPDRRTVTGGQARGPFAIVPMCEPGGWPLRPVLWRWMGPEIGSPGWVRCAAFMEASIAVKGARALHLAGGDRPAWLKPDGLADVGAVERVLMAAGMLPGRIGASPLRVYASRR